MRKRTFCLLLFTLFIVAFAAKDTLFSLSFQWYIKNYCRSQVGGKLTYENLYQENGKWILEHPVLKTKKTVSQGGYHFHAQQAKIGINILWSELTLDLAIELKDPQIEIANGARELQKILYPSKASFQPFHVHTHFKIAQGTFFIRDLEQENSTPFNFSLDLDCQATSEGQASIWLHNPEIPFVNMTLSETEAKASQLMIDFLDVDYAILTKALKKIFPDHFPFEITDGICNGDLMITLPSNFAAYAEGKVTLKHVRANYPQLQCSAVVPEMNLNLTTTATLDQKEEKTYYTVGRLEIAHEASVIFFKNHHPYWTIDTITGFVDFNTSAHAIINFKGICKDPERSRLITLESNTFFSEKRQDSVVFDLRLKDEEEVSVHFSARELGEDWNFAEVDVSNFGMPEFTFIQHLGEKFYPTWKQLKILNGSLDASILVYTQKRKVSEVKVEHLNMHQLDFTFDPLELSAGVSDMVGMLSFDLSAEDVLHTLNMDVGINDGRVNLVGMEQARWQLEDIDTNLKIADGIIQKSLLKGKVAGLKGEIELDATSTGPLIKMNFGGSVQDLATVFPELISHKIEENFSGDHLRVIAEGKKYSEGVLFKGDLLVQPHNQSLADKFSFEFSLEKASKKLWKSWPAKTLSADYYAGAGLEALQALTPAILSPSSEAYRYLLKNKLGLAGFTINQGHFTASQIKLEKYLSPFIFLEDQMTLSGRGDFQGTFDSESLRVNYDAQNLILSNVDFNLEIQSISQSEHKHHPLIAKYIYDFDRNRGFSTIPISNGIYFEKNSGLLFTDVNAKVFITTDQAHVTDLVTYCNGVFFAGNIDVDWSDPIDDIYTIDIQADQMHGKISQLQDLFSHFEMPPFLTKLPLEGYIALHKKGAHLHFAFQPRSYQLQTHVQGVLTDGVLIHRSEDLQLQELGLNFEYDQSSETLEFSDILGTVLVGSSKHVDEYALSGETLRFTNYSKNEAEFDLWVEDKKRNLIRLAGTTHLLIDEEERELIDFNFDYKTSHFGDVHPTLLQLRLKDWSEVDSFKLDFNFELKTLFTDLQKFSRTGLLFLSRSFLKGLNEIEFAEGDFKTTIDYNRDDSLFQYHIDGEEIKIGPKEYKKFSLIGNKKGSIWKIEQLLLDEISFAMDIHKEDFLWNINFLGARFGESILLGLEGRYNSKDEVLKGKINLLEIDLSKLNEWPTLFKELGGLNAEGEIRANGTVNAEFSHENTFEPLIEIQATGSLHNSSINGLHLLDFENAAFSYHSDKGFLLHQVKTGFVSAKTKQLQAALLLSKMTANFSNHEVFVNGLAFSVPSQNLSWLTENLQQSFPEIFTQPVADLIRFSKKEGDLQGEIKVEVSDPFYSLQLHLNDGNYQLFGADHTLKNFSLDYDPFSLRILSNYSFNRYPLRLEVLSHDPGFRTGQLVVLDPAVNKIGMRDIAPPMTINWKLDSRKGYFIEKIYGAVCGITCDLIKNNHQALPADQLNLTGNVDVDLAQAKVLVGEGIAAKITAWGLGRGYTLHGDWVIDKNEDKKLIESVQFNGHLQGSNYEVLDYQFQKLSSKLTMSSQTIVLNGLTMTDPCGNMRIDKITLLKAKDALWQLYVPLMTIYDFQPSLLRSIKGNGSKNNKALVIQQIHLEQFKGVIGNKTSFTGKGNLDFICPQKNNLQNTIFAIPAEILTRIGLDLDVLNPVKGTIEYKIAEGKILLTNFKDVYSKKKMSKFYLANNHQSYVDFDGHLNVQVKMKQYNLIFKLAELFTVNIQGTLKKPVYTLNKQQ